MLGQRTWINRSFASTASYRSVSFENQKKIKEGYFALLFEQLNAEQVDDEPPFLSVVGHFLGPLFLISSFYPPVTRKQRMFRTNPDSLSSCPCFRVFRLKFASDFFNLLLVRFYRAEIIIVKHLIQGRNNEAWVGDEPSTLRSWPCATAMVFFFE